MSTEAARVVAAMMIKAANNEDLAGSMAKLEALRQNAMLRHGIRSEGMIAGGRAAGGTAGAGAGAIGGLAGLLRAFGRGAGWRGKLGLAAGGAVGGGVAGGLGGSAAGGSLAKLHVPKMPAHMETAVTPDTASAVSATLAKAAADGANIIARMEKTANMWGKLGRGAMNLFTKPVKGAMPGIGGRIPRQFSPLRTAGVGYAGALGAHHTGLLGGDPTRGMDDVEKFRYHTGEYNQKASPLNSQLETALRSGNMEEAMKLQDQLQAGNFGGGGFLQNNMLTRTFMPWVTGGQTASQHTQAATASQSAMQGKYDTEMQKQMGQPGQFQTQIDQLTSRMNQPGVMPQHRRLMQQQVDALKRRLSAPAGESEEASAIAARMRGAGMQFTPHAGLASRPAAPAAGPQPYSGWNLGGRPRMPGYMTGAAMMPGDFRPYQQPWDFVQQSGSSPFSHG